MRSIDLFAGAGGLALGVHAEGFANAALVEWDHDACETLRSNVALQTLPLVNDWQVLETDSRAVRYDEWGHLDLITGGPPCQPFSIGGKHRGMEDTRNMIPEFVRAVREAVPSAFIMENVRGLARASFRTYFSYILLSLSYPTVTRHTDERWLDHLARLEDIHTRGSFPDLHYNVVSRVLNAADYGVPQTRERLFAVGFRADTGVEWHFPEATHSMDKLLHDQWITGDYWKQHDLPMPAEPPTWVQPRLRAHLDRPSQPWRTVRQALADLPEPVTDTVSERIPNHRLIPGARVYVGHTGSPIDFPAKTLKAGDHGVPGGENIIVYPDGSLRYFTAREAARLQTFPDAWLFRGAWTETMRQIGNAVPVSLARVIAHSIHDSLHGSR